MIMIIGCGRSGTKFTNELFEANGFQVGHEQLGKDGIVSWTLVPDTDKRAWMPSIPKGKLWIPSFKELEPLNLPIAHQVRHPLAVVSSMQTAKRRDWWFISRFLDIEKQDSPILKNMKYWYYWNSMAETKASHSYRIENIENEFDRLCHIATFPIRSQVTFDVKTSVNAREHDDVTWNDLDKEDKELARRIRGLARRYGYETS
jgi:hypothetical protein